MKVKNYCIPTFLIQLEFILPSPFIKKYFQTNQDRYLKDAKLKKWFKTMTCDLTEMSLYILER